jgi:hypothetical protein
VFPGSALSFSGCRVRLHLRQGANLTKRFPSSVTVGQK